MKETTDTKYTGLEIAIIGMACRVPGANDWRTFWDNLTNGREAVHFLSAAELAAMGVHENITRKPNYVNAVIQLQDKDLFDASFFEYRPVEAAYMNPVHRVFHTCVWEALEDAGIDPSSVKEPIGVFAGSGDDTNWRLYSGVKNVKQDLDGMSQEIMSSKDFLASLLSYKLDLKGPVMFMHTTCSTSLVAINLATKALLFGEANIAVAGGISLKTRELRGYMYEEGMINSQDGHCRAFDKDASGTVPGEGAGVIVLKRLKDAIQDGDHIYAVIRSTAINNDGNRKVGYTAPSVEGQVECIRRAQKFAKIDPATITYVETHGTGTRLGDPVEIEALNLAFNNNTDHRCAIGSVKTNIGHLDTAAGVIGVIKTALSLKHRKIPASLHYREPNPEIAFDSGPFYVNQQLQEWNKKDGMPLRAGVSSFGIGGTNAHAILEEAPQEAPASPAKPFQLVTLSAKTESSLLRYTEKLKNFLPENNHINLADLSWSFQTGRKQFLYRLSFACKDLQELSSLLSGDNLHKQISKAPDQKRMTVFLFPGQGSQYPQMCRDLYQQEPFFREELDKGFALLEKLCGESMKNILFPADEASTEIHSTRYTQPLLFLVEYTLAGYLRSVGIVPQMMLGHSIGEYVAACLAGVIKFEDALRIVVKRGELMNSLPGGVMVSVAITAEEAATYLNEEISLAAVNAPEQSVLSGTPEAMNKLVEQLDKAGTPYTTLRTSHAFHSVMLNPVLDEFRQLLETIVFQPPAIPFISNLTGKLITASEAMSPEYWTNHMRHTVKFSDGINTLLAQSRDMIAVEVGAGHGLKGLLQLHLPAKNVLPVVNLVRHSKEKKDDLEFLTSRIGQLWCNGLSIDWARYHGEQQRKKIPLPAYAFEPTRFPAVVDPFSPALMQNWGFSANRKPQALQNALYFPFWKGERLTTAGTDAKKTLLFFSFSKSFAKSFAEQLKNSEHEVVFVYISEEYARISAREYALSPADALQFDQLLSDIVSENMLITDIVYSWGMGTGQDGLDVDVNDPVLTLTYFALVNIVQSLLRRESLEGSRIAVITDSLHTVLGTEIIQHHQSLLLGLVQVIGQEHAVSCCNIDINLKENFTQYMPLLVAEVCNNQGKEDRLVALRNGRRWMQDHQQNDTVPDTHTPVIRKGGTYLITGGLGNLGFVLANYLIRQYDAKLIITGRRQVPLASSSDHHQDTFSQRLDRLHQLSNDIRYYSMDVSVPEELETVVQHAESVFGQIHGVIHTAGIVGNNWFQFIEDISVESALEMLAPKVNGIHNLFNSFRHRSPDFVWASSSLSTVLGGLGFASYAAANQYMDHFIARISAAFPAWRSVGLGEMIWEEPASGNGGEALTPSEIVRVFEWSLSQKGCPLIIETKTLLEDRKQKIYHARQEKKDTAPELLQELKTERKDLSAGYAAPATPVEHRLCELYEDFFGTSPIGVEDNFFELGGDSLKAMVLVKRLRAAFSINLPLKEFLHHASIRQLSVRVEELQWLSSNQPMENEITI